MKFTVLIGLELACGATAAADTCEAQCASTGRTGIRAEFLCEFCACEFCDNFFASAPATPPAPLAADQLSAAVADPCTAQCKSMGHTDLSLLICIGNCQTSRAKNAGTCEAQCASAGHSGTSTESCSQHPSCLMGCSIVAAESASAEECKATCTAHDNTCDFWTAGGQQMDNCGVCSGDYAESQSCLSGCDYFFASAPATPATNAGTCEAQCASAGHSGTSTESCAQHPSCLMGCSIAAAESASAEECKATCTAHDNTCDFWTAGGQQMDNCGVCSGDYAESQSCLSGCDYFFASAPATPAAPLVV